MSSFLLDHVNIVKRSSLLEGLQNKLLSAGKLIVQVPRLGDSGILQTATRDPNGMQFLSSLVLEGHSRSSVSDLLWSGPSAIDLVGGGLQTCIQGIWLRKRL